jgi:hypothetical protein
VTVTAAAPARIILEWVSDLALRDDDTVPEAA